MNVVPLDEAHLPAWRALFDAAGCPCFCRYWHFEGDKNAWLDRCANAREASFEEHAACVRANDDRARGLVALEDGACIGWMKLAPRAVVPKLRRLPVYRALDLGTDDGVWSIGCFLVHPAHRGRGVARALLAAAEDHVAAWGGRVLEGYPRRTGDPMHPEEAWMGPLRVFEDRAYRVVAGEGQYPVLRKILGSRERGT